MARRTTLPGSPDDVDAAWLGAVLRDAWAQPALAVSGARVEIIGEDRGFTGVVARVHVDLMAEPDGVDVPRSLIAKFPMARRAKPSSFEVVDERPEARARRLQWAAREIGCLSALGGEGRYAVPRLYFGAVDEAGGTICLLLEDVRASEAGDVLAGCSGEQAASFLDAIAPIHADWWRRMEGEGVAWAPRWGNDPEGRQARFDEQADAFLAGYGPGLPAGFVAVVEEMRTGYAAVVSALRAAPATLIHGDLHLDNVLFAGERATIIDWQSVSAGAAAVDVAFFLVGSLTPEERRRCEDDLLIRYHRQLVTRGVRDYPKATLVADYRRAIVWMVAGYVGWLANAVREETSGRERALLDAAMGDGRLVSAVADHVPSLRALMGEGGSEPG